MFYGAQSGGEGRSDPPVSEYEYLSRTKVLISLEKESAGVPLAPDLKVVRPVRAVAVRHDCSDHC